MKTVAYACTFFAGLVMAGVVYRYEVYGGVFDEQAAKTAWVAQLAVVWYIVLGFIYSLLPQDVKDRANSDWG